MNWLAARARSQTAEVYALLSERVSAIRVIRSFAQEDAEVAELDKRIDCLHDLNWSSVRVGALQGSAAILVSGAGTVAVLFIGAWLLIRRQLSAAAGAENAI